jgi:antitoxin VapB
MSGFEEERRPFRAAEPKARAKLFAHGGSQAVRLPKAFRFEGTEVSIRKEGDRVILEPVLRRKPQTPEEWAAFWARLDAMTDEPFPEREPQPPLREIDLDS